MYARDYHPSVSDPSNMMGEPFAPGVQIPNVFYAISNVKEIFISTEEVSILMIEVNLKRIET
jgi:hypothetical protein